MTQPLKKEAAFDIFQVDPDELNKYWNFVRAQLKKMVEAYRVDWRPENIYVSVLAGVSKLFIAHETETGHDMFIGFIVAIQQQILCTNKSELFVWAVAGDGVRDLFETDKTKTLNFLIAYAKGLGCIRLHMLSPRKGFERWGFEMRQFDYYLDI